MKHLDLFSGIGGFALACQWAGIETIGFVEIDKYCQKVLRKHWPNVPIVEDIRDVKKIKEIASDVSYPSTEGRMAERPGTRITEQAIRETPAGQPCRTSGIYGNSPGLLVTAGFPCQPFSVAGKRQGERDDRYLWPQTIAVIKEIKPSWVLLENVTGIINLALDTVLSDLEGAGYSTETLIIPACAVNAWHRRDRVWIVANAKGTRTWEDNGGIRQRFSRIDGRQDPVIADTQREGLERTDAERQVCPSGQLVQPLANTRLLGQTKRELQTTRTPQCDWWAVEPELGRVAHGIPHRVDRLKCLGNAIVPQVATEIIRVIKEVDDHL